MPFETTASIPVLVEISRELVRGLPAALSGPRVSNRLWTREVTDYLCGMGNSLGMLVCCHGSKDSGEWLLDVVWMGRDRHDIALAVESEWGKPGDVEDDFDKLMSIKSPRKLLLFGTRNEDESRDVVSRLERNMQQYPYHLVGEEYMAIDMRAEGAVRYCFRVPNDGLLGTVHFDQLVL